MVCPCYDISPITKAISKHNDNLHTQDADGKVWSVPMPLTETLILLPDLFFLLKMLLLNRSIWSTIIQVPIIPGAEAP